MDIEKEITSQCKPVTPSPNERQVGGKHYAAEIQHWDFAASHQFDYFQGQITKYVTRWRRKNGLQDLEKAQHFLEKYIELERLRLEAEGEARFQAEIAFSRRNSGA